MRPVHVRNTLQLDIRAVRCYHVASDETLPAIFDISPRRGSGLTPGGDFNHRLRHRRRANAHFCGVSYYLPHLTDQHRYTRFPYFYHHSSPDCHQASVYCHIYFYSKTALTYGRPD